MQLGLTVTERLMVLNYLLPSRGRITEMRTVQKLIENVGLTDEELAILKPEEIDNRVNYTKENEEAVGIKNIEFSDVAIAIIGGNLRALEEKEELPLNMLTLYEKLCGSES